MNMECEYVQYFFVMIKIILHVFLGDKYSAIQDPTDLLNEQVISTFPCDLQNTGYYKVEIKEYSRHRFVSVYPMQGGENQRSQSSTQSLGKRQLFRALWAVKLLLNHR